MAQETQLWQRIRRHGRPKRFEDPLELLELAEEYFEWADKTPMHEHKQTAQSGDVVDTYTQKTRPYTIEGMCVYCGIGTSTLHDYKQKKEKINGISFAEVCEFIITSIREQKLAGATNGLFNATIVARDLGLTDRQETKQTVTVNIEGKDALV